FRNFFLCLTLSLEGVNDGLLDSSQVGSLTHDCGFECSMPKPCNVYGFTDWYKVGSVCVKYFNRPLNFTDAEFNCRTKVPGAHLVSVHKKEHNDYLLCIVKKFNPNNLRIWLEAFELFKVKKKTAGVYKQGDTEECVEMNWKEIGKWNDDACYVKKNYICAFKRNAILKPGSEEME
uniref:C-type lectin domain-containing protein n=1 Tax=Cyprinus carpio carpio TaxID=630221 RepID=A0A8C1FMC9_CYPCA